MELHFVFDSPNSVLFQLDVVLLEELIQVLRIKRNSSLKSFFEALLQSINLFYSVNDYSGPVKALSKRRCLSAVDAVEFVVHKAVLEVFVKREEQGAFRFVLLHDDLV